MTQKVDKPAWEQGEEVRVPFVMWGRILEVDCIILDHRQAYGRDDWLIMPVKGGDTPIWISTETILGETEAHHKVEHNNDKEKNH